jgi:hypothetical protein
MSSEGFGPKGHKVCGKLKKKQLMKDFMIYAGYLLLE